MRQLDLQAPFPRARTPAEDLQNETRPVENLGVPGPLEIALLDGRHGMVDDDQLEVLRLDLRL